MFRYMADKLSERMGNISSQLLAKPSIDTTVLVPSQRPYLRHVCESPFRLLFIGPLKWINRTFVQV